MLAFYRCRPRKLDGSNPLLVTVFTLALQPGGCTFTPVTRSVLGGALCLGAGVLWLVMGVVSEPRSSMRIAMGAALVVLGIIWTRAGRRSAATPPESESIEPQDDDDPPT